MRRFAIALGILVLAGCTAQVGPPESTPTPGSAEGNQAPAAPSPTPTPGATPGPTPTATPAITTPATATPAGPAPSRSPRTTSSAAAAPTLAQLIGQKLMVKMSGTTPSASLLARARAG